MDPKSAVVLCRPHEAKIYGHHAALVLSQLRYWRFTAFGGQNIFVVERFGQKWVARSREQLCEETAFSPKQLRLALEKLKQHGCIVIEQHLLGGKNVGHFLLDEETDSGSRENSTTKQAQQGAPDEAQQVHDEQDQKGQLLTNKTNLKIKKEYSALRAPLGCGKLSQEEKNKEKKKNKSHKQQSWEMAPPMVDASWVGRTTDVDFYEIVTSVVSRFRAAWEDAYPKENLPEFGPKELGQFRSLVRRSPSGMAGDVAVHCVRHWPEFCSRAKAYEAAYHLPERPTVGPIERWLRSALKFYLDDADTEIKKGCNTGF